MENTNLMHAAERTNRGRDGQPNRSGGRPAAGSGEPDAEATARGIEHFGPFNAAEVHKLVLAPTVMGAMLQGDIEHRRWAQFFRIIHYNEGQLPYLLPVLARMVQDHGLRIYLSSAHPGKMFCKGPNVSWGDILSMHAGRFFESRKIAFGVYEPRTCEAYWNTDMSLKPAELTTWVLQSHIPFRVVMQDPEDLIAMGMPLAEDFQYLPGYEPCDAGVWYRVSVRTKYRKILLHLLNLLAAGEVYQTVYFQGVTPCHLPGAYFVPQLTLDMAERIAAAFAKAWTDELGQHPDTWQQSSGFEIGRAPRRRDLYKDRDEPFIPIRHLRPVK